MTLPRLRAVHPALFAAFPPLLLYSRNLDSVDPAQVLGPMLLAVVGALALWGGLGWWLRNPSASALVASALVAATFGHGRDARWLGRLGLAGSARDVIALAIEGIGVAAMVWVARARPSWARRADAGLNAAGCALVGGTVATIATGLGADHRAFAGRIEVPTPVAIPADRPPQRRPDIYFLVLDGYGRHDVLRDVIGFDNGAFLDRLRGRGFFVADRSTANYCQTALSVAATLNAAYHDDLAGVASTSRLPLRARIADGRVIRTLRALGYRIAAFDTGFHMTDLTGADSYRSVPGDLSEFHRLVLDQTPARGLLDLRTGSNPNALHRRRTQAVFDNLPAVARGTGPTFTFAHVVAPHPPFVFDADGRPVGDAPDEPAYTLADGLSWSKLAPRRGPDTYAARYRGQVAYITRRVEATVAAILDRSPEPPIIIIQGDHGPGSHFDSDADQPNDLAERFGVLNAILLPGDRRAGLSPTLSPVNTFRVVFDRTFGSNLGLLDDRSYYSPYRAPYRLVDVTAAVRRLAPAE